MTTCTDTIRPIKQTRPATWQAYNGHYMDGVQVRWLYPGEAPTPWRTEGWSAQHSCDCTCEGESLSEFAGEEY